MASALLNWSLVLVSVFASLTVLDAAPSGGEDAKAQQADERHCMQITTYNNTHPSACPHGCVRGWLGSACNIKRIKPEVNYFCVDMGRDRDATALSPYVLIRARTNGIEHVNLFQMSGSRVLSVCSPIHDFNDTGTQPGPRELILKVAAPTRYNNQRASATHACPYSTGKTEWLLSVSESTAVTLENDLEVMVTCNFSSKTDNRQVASQVTLDGVPPATHRLSQNASRLSDDVILEVVNITTDQAITKSYMGAPVKLRLTFGLVEGSAITSVRPYRCRAKSTEKGSGRTATLTDSSGCSQGVVPQFNVTSAHTLETGWFPLFGISGQQGVSIQCSYTVCFGDQKCGPVCGGEDAPSRRRRDLTLDDAVNGQVDVHVQVTKPEA